MKTFLPASYTFEAYDKSFKLGILLAIATVVSLLVTVLLYLLKKNNHSNFAVCYIMTLVTMLLFWEAFNILGDYSDTHEYSLANNKNNTNIVFKPNIKNKWAYRFDLFKYSVKTTSYSVFYKPKKNKFINLGRMENGKFYPAKDNDAGYAFAKLGNKVLQRHLTKNFLANAWFKTNAHESTLTSQKDHVKYKLIIPVKEHKFLIN